MNVISKSVIYICKIFSLDLYFLYKTVSYSKSSKTLTLLSLVVLHHCGDCSDGLVFGRRSSDSLMNI